MSIPSGLSVRNILRTDAFKILKSAKDLKIVVFTPLFDNKDFKSEFGGENILFEDMERYKPNLLERYIHWAKNYVFFNIIAHAGTIKVREKMLKSENYLSYIQFKVLRKILGKNKNLIIALEMLDRTLFGHKYRHFRHLFEKHHPALFLSTDFLVPGEWGLIKTARKYRVPIITVVANWDHLVKGKLPKSEKVIVWSDFQKKQLIEYYGYKANDIFIAGIPHTDYFVYYQDEFLTKRKLMKKIGASPNKKLITYTTGSRLATPFEHEIVEIICKAIRDGRIAQSPHLHVRLHPADDFGRYEKLKRYSEFITFEEAGRFATKELWFPSEKDLIHYANLLACSDVVVNVASTVSLDAAIFDTPIVNLAFDGYKKRKFHVSNTRYFQTTHYSALVKTGAVSVARNAGEMVNFINKYLSKPELDKEKREKAVKEQCYKVDGQVGKRIARYVLEFLKHEN
jgi:CDP-glycerol glycerophosphotransferase (TagB/SpsB family)